LILNHQRCECKDFGETGGGGVWLVIGSNGEKKICAEGRSQAEAWDRATLQAEAVGMLAALKWELGRAVLSGYDTS
jgi:hypothetical protein